MANRVQEVTGHTEHWAPAPGTKLYLERHKEAHGLVPQAIDEVIEGL